ncbi:MAG: carboxypeptidase-like regulatory domain-containing protein, partial [Gemmatimonadota bacterium]|nr:carboxypeptidase-like regulatory domain-containing protein [Gemmatimonadota bacterium]
MHPATKRLSRWDRLRRDAGVVLLFAAGFASVPDAAGGQATGAVQGRVRDDEGSAIFAATVRVVDAAGRGGTAESDRLGFFRVAGLT